MLLNVGLPKTRGLRMLSIRSKSHSGSTQNSSRMTNELNEHVAKSVLRDAASLAESQFCCHVILRGPGELNVEPWFRIADSSLKVAATVDIEILH
jgi:hypothetical protein